MPPSTTTAKLTTRLQNNDHPELSENQAVWKSKNQGFKETTFIQMGRRSRDAETCRQVERHGEVWRGGEEQRGTETQSGAQRCGDTKWVVPHLHVVDKNQQGYLWSKGSQAQTKPLAEGFSVRKVSPHKFWL